MVSRLCVLLVTLTLMTKTTPGVTQGDQPLLTDLNDLKFDNSTYEATVQENSPPGTSIVQVHATSPTGNAKYSFSSRTSRLYGNTFGIERNMGLVYLKQPIDAEEQAVYILGVYAIVENDTLPIYTRINVQVIGVNDNAPFITVNALTSSGSIEVEENAPLGTFVAHASVYDPDGGRDGLFNCTIDNKDFTLIRMFETEYKIMTDRVFDREEQPAYDFNMECTDRGNPTLTTTEQLHVIVLDQNDNSPQFLQATYRASLQENNYLGTMVAEVAARDMDANENGAVRYSLGSQYSELFAIDERTGMIRAKVSFDHEVIEELKIIITAHDLGSPSLSSTAVLMLDITDVNDEIPLFATGSYSFSVFERRPPGTKVGVVYAIDGDSEPYNKVTYAFDINTDGSDQFNIDSQTGVIASQAVLDREAKSKYHLRVVAMNDGYHLMSKVTVTVNVLDVNDNAPVLVFPFERTSTIKLSRSTPVGTRVTRIHATDADVGKYGEITYTIADQKGNDQENFVIDGNTGVITLAMPIDDEIEEVKILVKADDSGTPHLRAIDLFTIVITD